MNLVELHWSQEKRARCLGALVAALRRGDSVRIRSDARELGALPLELRLLIDAKAAHAARGASMGLGVLGSRAALAGLALGRLVAGGAALGAALAAGLLSGVLDRYAFRVALERDESGAIVIEGAPRTEPRRAGDRPAQK